ncbi:hypothetical protein MFLO_07362 [Listeria floridensis FSL S10-1187]|uniref:Uncharacterized protein n=1 Tax=Listeria floridensis FSL S10-1187 TaxID=1265817 RepID=A0ABP3AZY8_9LIST|nr:hypothetical protein [Listeria floridensis]EUJ31989.1 hypothetical protein MFLO_07362 [Listeria floridensis FSL S10-1187]
MAAFSLQSQSAEAASKAIHVGVLAASEVSEDEITLHAQTNLPHKMKFFAIVTGPENYEKEVKLKVKKRWQIKKKPLMVYRMELIKLNTNLISQKSKRINLKK